jgi:hypothetical protein
MKSKTPSQSASESRARRKEREGWRRGEVIVTPDLDAALQRLIARGYAPDQQACFRRAVIEAAG